MNNRDRLLAVLQGEQLDRVPFAQYDGIAPNEEAWSLVGRENLGLLRWSAIHHVKHPNCRSEAVPIERNGLRG